MDEDCCTKYNEESEESIVGAKRFFATDDGLGIFHAYFGAPATVALAEALVASGIKQLIIFGEAGSISPTINVANYWFQHLPLERRE